MLVYALCTPSRFGFRHRRRRPRTGCRLRPLPSHHRLAQRTRRPAAAATAVTSRTFVSAGSRTYTGKDTVSREAGATTLTEKVHSPGSSTGRSTSNQLGPRTVRGAATGPTPVPSPSHLACPHHHLSVQHGRGCAPVRDEHAYVHGAGHRHRRDPDAVRPRIAGVDLLACQVGPVGLNGRQPEARQRPRRRQDPAPRATQQKG